MSDPTSHRLDVDEEISVAAAAELLDFAPAHVQELLRLDVLPSRRRDGVAVLRRGDVLVYREVRRRRRRALAEIARIVDASSGGWDQ